MSEFLKDFLQVLLWSCHLLTWAADLSGVDSINSSDEVALFVLSWESFSLPLLSVESASCTRFRTDSSFSVDCSPPNSSFNRESYHFLSSDSLSVIVSFYLVNSKELMRSVSYRCSGLADRTEAWTSIVLSLSSSSDAGWWLLLTCDFSEEVPWSFVDKTSLTLS